MSTKYNSIANEFAAELRGIRSDFPNTCTKVEVGAWRIIHLWMGIERKRNPRFDADRFAKYIEERV